MKNLGIPIEYEGHLMDRFGLRRDGDTMVVDVDKFYRQDENAAEWDAAFLTL